MVQATGDRAATPEALGGGWPAVQEPMLCASLRELVRCVRKRERARAGVSRTISRWGSA